MKKAELDKPIVLRKEIIKKAVLESGLIKAADIDLFEKFWDRYKAILLKCEKEYVVFD